MVGKALVMSARHTSTATKKKSALAPNQGIKTRGQSSLSLYREDLTTFEEDGGFAQRYANGVIRLNALRLAISKAPRQSRSTTSGKKKGIRSR